MHPFASTFGLAVLAGPFSVAVPCLAGKGGKDHNDGH